MTDDAKLDRIINLLEANAALIMNGSQDLRDDYYGNESRSIKGTKPQVEENTSTIGTGKTVVRTLLAVVGLIGVGNLVALLALLGG